MAYINSIKWQVPQHTTWTTTDTKWWTNYEVDSNDEFWNAVDAFAYPTFNWNIMGTGMQFGNNGLHFGISGVYNMPNNLPYGTTTTWTTNDNNI